MPLLSQGESDVRRTLSCTRWQVISAQPAHAMARPAYAVPDPAPLVRRLSTGRSGPLGPRRGGPAPHMKAPRLLELATGSVRK